MNFLGFATPLADIGSRLEFLVSILLTNIAFTFSVNQELPKIGYYTQLDYFFTSGIFAPFFAGLGTALSYYWNMEQIEMCDRKAGSHVTNVPIYNTQNDQTTFADIECPFWVETDQWFFRVMSALYMCIWIVFYLRFRRIKNSNQAYLENALYNWNERLARQGVEKKKRKHERYDRYEVREISEKQVLLKFFKDGLNF